MYAELIAQSSLRQDSGYKKNTISQMSTCQDLKSVNKEDNSANINSSLSKLSQHHEDHEENSEISLQQEMGMQSVNQKLADGNNIQSEMKIKNKIKEKFIKTHLPHKQIKKNQSVDNIDHRNPENYLYNYYLNNNVTRNLNQNQGQEQQIRNKSLLSTINQSGRRTSLRNNKTQLTFKMDITLPLIQSNFKKKNKSTIKANHMQFWLDQALDPQGSAPSSNTQTIDAKPEQSSKQDSMLSTIKKYKIDRQYLKSQNVPAQVIDRLYSTLYIYTHGIQKLFGELLSYGNNNSNDKDCDKMILCNFWRTFIKLLQNCTSFQTTFQVVEKGYLQKISQLKQLIQKRQKNFQQQKQQLEKTIKLKDKRILQQLNTLQKLELDFKITNSSLMLNQQAFNDEVQLRLKFEEKINHVYTSYEQLKVKYNDLVQKVNLQAHEGYQMVNNELRLKEKLQQLQIKYQQTEHLLKLQRLKVNEREQQIIIKKQQYNDLFEQKKMKEQMQEQKQCVFENQINRNKLLLAQIQSIQIRLLMVESINKELQRRQIEQNLKIDEYRELNEDLHRKYDEQGRRISEFEKDRVYQGSEIARLTSQLKITKDSLQFMQLSRNQYEIRLLQSQQQLMIARLDIESKLSMINKITDTIQQLKAIKDKHEVMYKILLQQKSTLQMERNEMQQKYSLQNQEIQGYRLLQENREKHIKQIEMKNDKQREMLKRKISGFSEIATKKENLLLNYQKDNENLKNGVIDGRYRVEMLEKGIQEMEKEVQRVGKDKQLSETRVRQLEQLLEEADRKIKQLSQQVKNELKFNDIIKHQQQSLQQLLKILKSQQTQSVNNILTFYQEYRETLNKKVMFIHPMMFEDVMGQLNRVELEKVPKLERVIGEKEIEIKEIGVENEGLKKEVEGCEGEIKRLEDELGLIRSQCEGLQKQLKNIKLTNEQLQSKLQASQTQISTLTSLMSTKINTINSLNTQILTLSDQLTSKTSIITLKDIQIEQYRITIRNLNDKISKLSQQQQVSTKQYNNMNIMKIERLQKEIEELRFLKKGEKEGMDAECQTVAGEQFKKTLKSSGRFERRNQFVLEAEQVKHQQTQTQNNQTSTTMYSNSSPIPVHIDQTINETITEQKNDSKLSSRMQSKELSHEEGLIKQQSPKNGNNVTKKQQFKRALKFTFMRR